MSNARRSNGTRRTRLRGWLKAQGRPCWICRAFGRSGFIDYSLPPGHPFSFEVDELVPVSKGGSPSQRSNVDAAHRCCDEWRGDRAVEDVLELAKRSRSGAAGASTQSIESERRSKPPVVESIHGVVSGISS